MCRLGGQAEPGLPLLSRAPYLGTPSRAPTPSVAESGMSTKMAGGTDRGEPRRSAGKGRLDKSRRMRCGFGDTENGLETKPERVPVNKRPELRAAFCGGLEA